MSLSSVPARAGDRSSRAARAQSFALVLLLVCFPAWRPLMAAVPAHAETPSPVVSVGDEPVLTIQSPIGPFSAPERAAAASTKLTALMKDVHSNPDDIHAVDRAGATDIEFGDTVLISVTDADAAAEGKTRDALADHDIGLMRSAILKVRKEHSYRSIALGALWALLTTAVLILLLVLLRRIFPAFYGKIKRSRGVYIRSIKVQSLELLSEERIEELLLQLAGLLRFVVTVLLLYFFIPLVFSFFPWTRSYGTVLIGYILSPVKSGWAAFIGYMPRLLVLLVIAFFAFLAIRLTRFIFREIERGTIAWPGFYPEWARPTQKIIQLLLLAFAVVIGFPYLPGSDSPAFKGVSIFLGVLFSLGSSSAVANVVAGVLLTYTRAFRIGDRVQIADTIGDVVEKGMLASQVRTIKNVLVTIPNSLVLSGQIINYSQSTQRQPLILHTTVTIGYDSPWRQVHTLLIAAASHTEGILADPAPFVLQTSLDDYYVSYQINAYTLQPSRMAMMYSELFQNIQDEFNKAGVEIMSPHYSSLRDGNSIAIPADHLPSDYQPSPFRVDRAVASKPIPGREGSS